MCPRPPRGESPAESRARGRPPRARARPVHHGATARPRPPSTAQTPDYRDVTARVLRPGPRGGVPGLAPDTRATRGSSRYRLGRPPPDLAQYGTPLPDAGLACSV